MRFIKALWLMVFFFFTLLFFIQNKDALGQELTLRFDTYYFNHIWTNTAVPFYFVVLTGFLAGVLVTLGYLFMDAVRIRRERGKLRKDNKILQKKNDELEHQLKEARAIPLQIEGGDKAAGKASA